MFTNVIDADTNTMHTISKSQFFRTDNVCIALKRRNLVAAVIV